MPRIPEVACQSSNKQREERSLLRSSNMENHLKVYTLGGKGPEKLHQYRTPSMRPQISKGKESFRKRKLGKRRRRAWKGQEKSQTCPTRGTYRYCTEDFWIDRLRGGAGGHWKPFPRQTNPLVDVEGPPRRHRGDRPVLGTKLGSGKKGLKSIGTYSSGLVGRYQAPGTSGTEKEGRSLSLQEKNGTNSLT